MQVCPDGKEKAAPALGLDLYAAHVSVLWLRVSLSTLNACM